MKSIKKRKLMNKSLVQQQFGSNAAKYVDSTVHAKGASLAGLVAAVEPKPDWRCLDIATGAGHTAFAFAPHVAHVVASDLTAEMLKQVDKQIADKDIKNVETARADAEDLPFESASFDLVTCRIAPHHFPDIAKFIGETFRVLKPRGTFALVDNVSPDESTTPGFTVDDLANAAELYNRFEKIRDPSHGRAWTAGEWTACMTENGFSIVHTEFLDKAMSFNAWCSNQAVPEETRPELAAMLTSADAAFKAYIRPSPSADDIGFTIIELLAIAKKAN